MQSLEKRVSLLEGVSAKVYLKRMTDDELRAYAKTCEKGSSQMYDAVLMLVGRHPSAFPIIVDDPDHAETYDKE